MKPIAKKSFLSRIVSAIFIVTYFSSSPAFCDQNIEEQIKSKKVKYSLDGKKYEIPLGYHWGAHLKSKDWPEPKDASTDVDGFEIFALLPDLSPYSTKNKILFDKRKGVGEVVEILVQKNSLRPRPLREILHDSSAGLEQVLGESAMPDFVHYLDRRTAADTKEYDDLYIYSKLSDADFWIRCRSYVPFPSCHAQESMPGETFVQFTFNEKYLSSSLELRKKIRELLKKFEVQENGAEGAKK